MEFTFTHIDTACTLIEIDGFRILTDPVFDPPGRRYHHGWGAFSRKTHAPAMTPAEIGPVDLVLLSHHQHKDNLDAAGHKFLESVPKIISTPAAAKKIPRTIGVETWNSTSVSLKNGAELVITSTPCRHGPKLFLPMIGQVTGFVLQIKGLESDSVYISGDTVFYEGVRQVAEKFRPGTAILHVGGVEFPYLSGKAKYTMDGRQARQALEVLQPAKAVMIHSHGWSHFRESESRLKEVVGSVPGTEVLYPEPGKPYRFE